MDFLMPSPKFATIDAWVLMSGMSRRSTYDYLSDGTLKAFKVGKRILIDVEAGIAWIRSHPAPQITPPAHKQTLEEIEDDLAGIELADA